jgi:PBSX family phage terminase large subunit
MPLFSPETFGERLRGFAFRPLDQDARITILEGSVRSGKTYALLPKILTACRTSMPGWKLLTGATKQTIFSNVLNSLFSCIPRNAYTYNHQNGLLKLMGSNWLVMGAKDEGSEKYLRGLTVSVAVCDEVTLMPQGYFQMLLTRMSPPGARFYGTTNTDVPSHWLKTEYLDNTELREKGILRSGHFTMADNPNLSPQFIEAQKMLYTGVFYERYILGLWVTAEGAIYRDCWGDENLYTEPPLGTFGPGGWQNWYIGIDYGTTNPCVFLDAIDDGQTVWIDREYYWDSVKKMRQKTDAEYADDLEQFIRESKVANGRSFPQIIVDPSAASFKAELNLRGIVCIDADNEVLDGIRTMSSALRTRKLRVHERCENFQREVQAYCWDDKKVERGKEEPKKQDDHAMDAARYLCRVAFPSWRLAN